MSDESFTLKVITPSGLAVEDTATQVVLPGSDGEVGVLSRHSRYTGLLGTGILDYYSAERKQVVRLVVTGGFCNFLEDSLVLLADSVDTLESVDRDNYGSSRAELQDSMKGKATFDPEWIYASEQLKRIEAIDRLISN